MVRGKVLVYGMGLNNADYPVRPRMGKPCPFYKIWVSMMLRCYCDSYHATHPTYKDATVCQEWLKFMAFKSWMETQDWHDKQLDKDVLNHGNLTYSPDTCVFIPQQVNQMLSRGTTKDRNLPKGVAFCCTSYRAKINIGGKEKRLGHYATPQEAFSVYVKAKTEEIFKVISTQTDQRIIDGLHRHIKVFENSLSDYQQRSA